MPLAMFGARHGSALRVRALPGTIFIGVGCVMVSRLVGFLPGYIYGLLIAVTLLPELGAADRGRTQAMSAALMLLVAAFAWLLLAPARGMMLPDDLARVFLETVLVALVVAGVESALFVMMPMRFLPGDAVFRWSKRAWALVTGIGLFGFFQILLAPSSAYHAKESALPTALGLLAAFSVLSFGFWAWYRFRGPSTSVSAPDVAPTAPPEIADAHERTS